MNYLWLKLKNNLRKIGVRGQISQFNNNTTLLHLLNALCACVYTVWLKLSQTFLGRVFCQWNEGLQGWRQGENTILGVVVQVLLGLWGIPGTTLGWLWGHKKTTSERYENSIQYHTRNGGTAFIIKLHLLSLLKGRKHFFSHFPFPLW